MKLIDVDKLIMQLPDDLPYKSSVSKVLAQAQELHIFKCPNCGNIECFTDKELKLSLIHI